MWKLPSATQHRMMSPCSTLSCCWLSFVIIALIYFVIQIFSDSWVVISMIVCFSCSDRIFISW